MEDLYRAGTDLARHPGAIGWRMAKASARTLTLRPADPFDLIRWLARSQSDPRKAVAELVQNSIDAQARHVLIERRRLRGGPAIVVRDDGEGGYQGSGARTRSASSPRTSAARVSATSAPSSGGGS
jgi:Histidine kinase-, DNA gyrase B-, and HSP90-like ATPase